MPPLKYYIVTFIDVNGSGRRDPKKVLVIAYDEKEAREILETETTYPLRQYFEVLSIELLELDTTLVGSIIRKSK